MNVDATSALATVHRPKERYPLNAPGSAELLMEIEQLTAELDSFCAQEAWLLTRYDRARRALRVGLNGGATAAQRGLAVQLGFSSVEAAVAWLDEPPPLARRRGPGPSHAGAAPLVAG